VAAELEPVLHNRSAWNSLVDEGNEWTVPVSSEVVERARDGEWSVVLIGYEPVDRHWFPAEMAGLRVLALGSGGGQQGPVLAAAGALVTVFDNSPRQLERDEEVAARDHLTLRTVLGDMRDLSVFEDGSFDLVLHPVSNVFCPDLAPVWSECFRVLQPGGALLAGFINPDTYIFDAEALDARSEFVVRHALPYSDLSHLTAAERERAFGPQAPLEYSHSMGDQVGGQLAAGFVITGFSEARHQASPTSQYMPGYFATRAVKPL
jgi:SAM-dependent methyltransferase